jgi:transposase
MIQQETKKKPRRARQGATKEMPVVHVDAAGIDIGSRSHWVAVPADRDAEPVREFSSFTVTARPWAS